MKVRVTIKSTNEDLLAFFILKTDTRWGIWWHMGGHEVKQTLPCLSEPEIRTDLIQLLTICATT